MARKKLSKEVEQVQINVIDWETKYNDLDARYQTLKNSNDALVLEYEKLRKRYSMTRKHMAERGQ